MTEQLTFDGVEGARRRDASIDQVREHADAEWLRQVDAAIALTSKALRRFTSDDIWSLLDRWGVERPREPRAMGAAMRSAQSRGEIVPLDEWRPTERPEGHRNPKRVWRRA